MKTPVIAVLVFALSESAAAQTAPVALREVMRIDGATEDITGSGLTTQVLRDNRVAFFDHGTGQFVFFDSTGKRIGKFGAKGEGPGEFGTFSGRSFALKTGVIGDTLVAFGSPARRFTLIGPDMKLVRTFMQPSFVPPVAAMNPMTALSGERLLARVDFGERVPTTTAEGRPSETWKASDSGIVVLAKDGSVERRIIPMPAGGATVEIRRPGEPYRTGSVPFAGSRLLSHSPSGDRVAFATTKATGATGTFTVTVVRTNGERVYSRDFAYTPEPVTKRMYDSAWARLDSTINRGQNAQQNDELRKLIRERMPTTLGPFRELSVGTDGTVWLRKTGPNEGPDEYVVIDPNGTQLPPVRMPRKNMRLLTGTRTHVWATETDTDGFMSVVRMVPAK